MPDQASSAICRDFTRLLRARRRRGRRLRRRARSHRSLRQDSPLSRFEGNVSARPSHRREKFAGGKCLRPHHARCCRRVNPAREDVVISREPGIPMPNQVLRRRRGRARRPVTWETARRPPRCDDAGQPATTSHRHEDDRNHHQHLCFPRCCSSTMRSPTMEQVAPAGYAPHLADLRRPASHRRASDHQAGVATGLWGDGCGVRLGPTAELVAAGCRD